MHELTCGAPGSDHSNQVWRYNQNRIAVVMTTPAVPSPDSAVTHSLFTEEGTSSTGTTCGKGGVSFLAEGKGKGGKDWTLT